MINKKRLILYFSIFAILLFGYMFFGKFGNNEFLDKESFGKNEIIEFVEKNDSIFGQLVDSIEKQIDTSFYAEYRGKENRYQLYYIYKDTIGNFFSINKNSENNVFSVAKSMEITQIWKFNSENFYRIQLIRKNNVQIQLLFLKSDQKQFSAGSSTFLSQYRTIDNQSKLDSSSDSFFYKVNEKLLIYFKYS